MSEVKAPKERITNRKFAETDVKFQSACSEAGVQATARQASKFRMKRGKAFNA